MGVNDREQNRKDDKRIAANAKKQRRHGTPKGSTPADWAGVDGQLMVRAIATITRCGCAIRFGYTRDGGAYAVGIYEDGEMQTDYLTPNDDMTVYLEGLIDDFTN